MAMTIGSRFSGDRTGYGGGLPVVRLVWSILAGRLLHLLASGGTTLTVLLMQQCWSEMWGSTVVPVSSVGYFRAGLVWRVARRIFTSK